MARRGIKLKAMGGHDDLIVEERVDNPSQSWAQFLYELETGMADPGLNKVAVNQTTLMGGFARFRGNEAQRKAASEYRKIWEASQVGGAKAIDPSVEPVDGRGVSPEAVFEIGADARRKYDLISTGLGRVDLARLHFVVVGEWGPTSYARWRYQQRNPDGRTIARGQVEVRDIADRVAKILGYA